MQTINIENISNQNLFSIEVYSNIGGRDEQQDCAYVTVNNHTLVAAVCDGMGGTEAGRIASRTAIAYLQKLHLENEDAFTEVLESIVDQLDASVYFLKDEYNRRIKAGTTLVLSCLYDNELYWLSVGDSRLYLKRDNRLVQITRDHNYYLELNELYDNGHITKDQYQFESAKGEALISYLGMGGIEMYDITNNAILVQKGDILLLATDGLWKSFYGDELYNALDDKNDLSHIKENLVNQVNKVPFSERDNHTFILIRIN